MGFTLPGFGPFLHWMTLGVLCVFPVLAAVFARIHRQIARTSAGRRD